MRQSSWQRPALSTVRSSIRPRRLSNTLPTSWPHERHARLRYPVFPITFPTQYCHRTPRSTRSQCWHPEALSTQSSTSWPRRQRYTSPVSREGCVTPKFAYPRWCCRDNERCEERQIGEEDEECRFRCIVKEVCLRSWGDKDEIPCEDTRDKCHDCKDKKNTKE
jgi:hypothetical protein